MLRWSGGFGMRCFSGGIVFVDVLEVLDATLSRFFSLTTERVSFTLYRRNILRLYYSLFADARAERPYIGEYTLSLCIVFGGLLRCRFGEGSTHCEWVFGWLVSLVSFNVL